MERLSFEKLAAYLDGEVTANEAARIEGLLEKDAELRRAYRKLEATRQALIRAVDTPAEAGFAKEIVRRIESPAKKRVLWRPLVVSTCVTVVAVLALWIVVPGEEPSGTFTARGPVSSKESMRMLGIETFVHPASSPGRSKRAHENTPVRPNDGFSFIVYNRSGERAYLMLFALDSAGAVHWFYPAVGKGNDIAESIVIPAEPQTLPLSEGVTPRQLPVGPFKIIALFSRRSLSTDEVEDALKRDGETNLSSIEKDAVVQTLTLSAE